MTWGEEEENGLIGSTMLGIEDHGILTFYLHLEFHGSGQGFGGYGLDKYLKKENKRIGTAFGTTAILRVLQTLEVNSWEKLKGTHVRVRRKEGRIESIGHIIKDQWLSLEELAEEMK